jgi:hypothetical protein
MALLPIANNIRGHRADDGFSWKLAVVIYVLLEFWATWLLKPRIFKRLADTTVDVGAKIILVTVLVVSLYYDERSGLRNGGLAVPADGTYCGNFIDRMSCSTVGHLCHWDVADTQCAVRPAPASVSWWVHLLYGLPGLAPLLLNRLFKPWRPEPEKSEKTAGLDPGIVVENPVYAGDWTVARVNYGYNPPPALPPAGGDDTPPPASDDEAMDPTNFEAFFSKARGWLGGVGAPGRAFSLRVDCSNWRNHSGGLR